MQQRYYVQRMSSCLFLVREAQLGQPLGATDRVVRQFEDAHDAHYYVDVVNGLQRKLDERYGRWTKRAV